MPSNRLGGLPAPAPGRWSLPRPGVDTPPPPIRAANGRKGGRSMPRRQKGSDLFTHFVGFHVTETAYENLRPR